MWAAESLLRGARRADVVTELERQGLTRAEADEAIRTIEASPVYEAAVPLARDARRHALWARLARRLGETGGPGETARTALPIPRRASLDAEELYEVFWRACTAVVLTELVKRWPAFGKWTPAWLRERFGEVEIRACVGRDSDPDYDMHDQALTEAMTLGAFVDRMLAVQGESNDLYMVAKNKNLADGALAALFDDVTPPPGLFDMSRASGGSALWLGPAGTVTPLHHDTSNILFCQLHGRKRVRLVSPHEPAALEGARSIYSAIDPERTDDPRVGELVIHDVLLEPGEALFIPVGWWHHVRALDASISLALNNFVQRNTFDWYRPGELRGGAA